MVAPGCEVRAGTDDSSICSCWVVQEEEKVHKNPNNSLLLSRGRQRDRDGGLEDQTSTEEEIASFSQALSKKFGGHILLK